jgi:V8-like Glu-specific endopeptidase
MSKHGSTAGAAARAVRGSTRRTIAIAAAIAAGGALAASPAALAAAPASVGAGHAINPVTQRIALAYWTPARLAAARPTDLITATPAQMSAGTIQQPAATGASGSVGGGAPTGEVAPFSPIASLPVMGPDGSFGVPTADYTKFPYRVNGRVFFSNPDGSGSCSGTSVASYHGTSLEDEVWTAGHCVGNPEGQHPGVWDTSAVFIPAYNGNSSNPDPYGEFSATYFYTTTAWLNSSDLAEDEAAFIVGNNSSGQSLGQAVGWDGFAWNYSDSESFNQFGYPAASPYNGTSMIQNVTSTSVVTGWGSPGQDVIGTPSPMNQGSSGGAWDIDWTTSADGYIDGHNDFISSSYPGTMFSPYQDSVTNTIRCLGASSC